MIDYRFVDENGIEADKAFNLYLSTVTDFTSEDLMKAGEWLKDETWHRTLSGVDVEGLPFAPYSPNTRKVGLVNLYSDRNSGPHMLESLEVRVTEGSLQVGIFDNEDLAERARALNEGASVTTRKGIKLSRFKGRGKRKILVPNPTVIPVRHWLGATYADLIHMQDIITASAAARAENLVSI